MNEVTNPLSDPIREIGKLWYRINRDLHDRFRQSFREMELQPMALVLLQQIGQEPGTTISELARRSGTAKSHVSKIIDQLVQQGLLEKRTDPTDQRLLRIYMTQAACDQKAQVEAKVELLWSRLLQDLPQTEVDQITAGLRALGGALERSREPQTHE